MTDVLQLLTLPKTSDAFTALRSTVVVEDVGEDRSKAPSPRKTPRLDHDSDPGSASRTNRSIDEKNIGGGLPIKIQVIGEPGGYFKTDLTWDVLTVAFFSGIVSRGNK
jgi:cullin-4